MNIKALFVVLVISAVVFQVAKSLALQFSTEHDFRRRRNVWFALTATAFLTPNFWLFALVAVPLLTWTRRRDPNPVALYLMLLNVIPPVSVNISLAGVTLFPIDNYRLLSFCVLIPTALRLRRSNDGVRMHGLTATDALLLAYGVIQIALFIPPDLPNHVILPDSFTNGVRRAFLFFIDTYVLYFVVSRSCSSRSVIMEAMATFCLSSGVMAALAFFEFLRHWWLYTDISLYWNDHTNIVYLIRGGMLRAEVTSGHPLALGYLLAIAFGFCLYFQYLSKHSNIVSSQTQVTTGHLRPLGYPLVVAFGGWLYLRPYLNWNNAALALIWLGLLAAYSRGPWIGAIIIYFAFAALGPRPLSSLFKAFATVAALGGVIALSPIGSKIISILPFIGGTDESANVIYRQRLAHRAWELIQANPLFGDQIAWTKMEDLRQGEGIIDLINTYAEIGLFYGICGLFLFLGVILVGLIKTFLLTRTAMSSDADLASLGVCLTACILGTLFMMASISFELGLEKMYYVLAGLSAAYAHLGAKQQLVCSPVGTEQGNADATSPATVG
jgi:O-Antigen ligase